MRTIKFRGKDIETGEWLYGHFFQRLGHYPAIVEPRPRDGKIMYCEIAVEYNTVGQFTGLTDKNGKEIYEGDIVKTKQFGKIHKEVNYAGYDIFEIQYINAQFMFFNEQRQFYLHRNTFCEIIGNIHDNFELLKGGANETTR